MKSSFKVILCYGLAILAMVAVIAWVYKGTTSGTEPLTDGKILQYFHDGEVATYKLDYNKGNLTIRLFAKDANGNFLTEDGTPFIFPEDENGAVDYTLPDGVKLKLTAEQTYKLADVTSTRQEIMAIVDAQMQDGSGVAILNTFENTPANTFPWWVSLLPGVIVVVALILLYVFAMKRMMNLYTKM